VISSDDMNAHWLTVIVAPMTTGSWTARCRIWLASQGKQGLVVLDQIGTLEHVRLGKRLDTLRSVTVAATLRTLQAKLAP